MTDSGKQKLRLLSIFLLLVSMLFWLEGRGAPGWKTGMTLLLMAVLTAIDFYLEKSKAFKLPYATFCLFFAIRNLLAH